MRDLGAMMKNENSFVNFFSASQVPSLMTNIVNPSPKAQFYYHLVQSPASLEIEKHLSDTSLHKHSA